ncbi:MAG: hypothetical protein RI897_2575 [Verrucomicrobiota bacterium]|jgi:hypothetical protein
MRNVTMRALAEARVINSASLARRPKRWPFGGGDDLGLGGGTGVLSRTLGDGGRGSKRIVYGVGCCAEWLQLHLLCIAFVWYFEGSRSWRRFVFG